MSTKKCDYKFVIPQVKKSMIGKEGEIATYIPCRMDETITELSIRNELKRQPHMKPLLEYLNHERRIYLIQSCSEEVLNLAADYIIQYHYPEGTDGWEWNEFPDGDDACEGRRDNRSFDFEKNVPYVQGYELHMLFDDEYGNGHGNRFYREDQQNRAPWWAEYSSSPVVIRTGCMMNGLDSQLRAMEERSCIIVLVQTRVIDMESESSPFWNSYVNLQDIAFELETEMIELEEPARTSAYKKEILQQLAREKGCSIVGGANTEKILSLIGESRRNTDNQTLSKAVSNALLRKKTPGKLTEKDFAYLSRVRAKEETAAEDASKMELIGQDAVKKQLERIVTNMSYQKKRCELGLPVDKFHYTFAFMGAPGTGKTTWALRLAEEMKKRKLLENTESICMNAAELKAQYVGWTTGKVKSIFEQYGVIILDEAYSLTEGGNGDNFGAEALAQLCVELENHGHDRLVIFAGYGGSNNSEDNRMMQFLQSNPGINSRVSFKVHFENFQPEELTEVFHSMMRAKGYQVSRSSDEVIAAFFAERMQERAFGNCREVRNLADRVKIHQAERLMKQENCTREEAEKIITGDIRKATAEILEEYRGLQKNHKKQIGFQ